LSDWQASLHKRKATQLKTVLAMVLRTSFNLNVENVTTCHQTHGVASFPAIDIRKCFPIICVAVFVLFKLINIKVKCLHL